MKQIENFMLPEHTNSLYEKEASSSIALTKDVAEKINELVEAYNKLSQIDLSWKQEQEGTIRKAVVYMKDNLINSLNDLMVLLRDSGFIDDRIAYHVKDLKTRVENLLSSVSVDGELLDIRVDGNGVRHQLAGESIRALTRALFNNPFVNVIPLQFYRKSFNGTWNESETRYCSNCIPASSLTIGDKIICNDSNYLITVRLMNEYNNSVVSLEGSWSDTIIIDKSHIENNHNIYVYVRDKRNNDVIESGLEDYFSKCVAIHKNIQKDVLFNKGNFDLSKLQQGVNSVMLKESLTDGDFHKYYCYRETSGKEIDFVDVDFIIPDNVTPNTYTPRLFLEDNQGNIVMISFVYNDTNTLIEVYHFDKITKELTYLRGGNVEIYKGLVNLKVRILNNVLSLYINDEFKFNSGLDYSIGTPVKCGLFYRGNVENTSYCSRYDVKYREPGFTHISFDDQISVLKDLTDNQNTYTSIFDNEMLAKLKELHTKYGCVFTLFLFETNANEGETPTFTLDKMTDKYRSEFIENSSWLKFGYHSKYMDSYSNTLTDDEVIENVTNFYNNVKRFAGNVACDRYVRFGFFSANKTAINKLLEIGLINGCLTADDDRASNTGLTANEMVVVNLTGEYHDFSNNTTYYKSLKRFDSDSILDDVVKYTSICSTMNNVLFAHSLGETQYNNLVEILNFLSNKNCNFKFPG